MSISWIYSDNTLYWCEHAAAWKTCWPFENADGIFVSDQKPTLVFWDQQVPPSSKFLPGLKMPLQKFKIQHENEMKK